MVWVFFFLIFEKKKRNHILCFESKMGAPPIHFMIISFPYELLYPSNFVSQPRPCLTMSRSNPGIEGDDVISTFFTFCQPCLPFHPPLPSPLFLCFIMPSFPFSFSSSLFSLFLFLVLFRVGFCVECGCEESPGGICTVPLGPIICSSVNYASVTISGDGVLEFHFTPSSGFFEFNDVNFVTASELFIRVFSLFFSFSFFLFLSLSLSPLLSFLHHYSLHFPANIQHIIILSRDPDSDH